MYWGILIFVVRMHAIKSILIVNDEFASFLYNLSDEKFVETLLEGPCSYFDEAESIDYHIDFLCVSFNFLCKLMSMVELY